MEFKAKLTTENIDIYSIKNWGKLSVTEDNDYTDIENDFEIIWALDIDAREWGIKNLSINVNSIKGTITVKDLANEEVNELTLDFDNSKENFEVNTEEMLMSEENYNPISSIFISNIEIDFSNKKITLI